MHQWWCRILSLFMGVPSFTSNLAINFVVCHHHQILLGHWQPFQLQRKLHCLAIVGILNMHQHQLLHHRQLFFLMQLLRKSCMEHLVSIGVVGNTAINIIDKTNLFNPTGYAKQPSNDDTFNLKIGPWYGRSSV